MSGKSETTMATTNPGFDGMDARRRGEPVEACPYQPGPQRTAWVVGWYLAAPEEPADA
jgi:ribosome modulation factor